MKIETQAPPVNWMNLPKEQQDRIVNLLGQLVRRRMEPPAQGRSQTNEPRSSKSNIDKSLQEWENSKLSSRSACDCICQTINNATGRAAPGINKAPIWVGDKSDTPGMAVPACESD